MDQKEVICANLLCFDLVIAWHLLSKHASYEELGGDYFDRCNADAYRKKLIHRLEALGLKVTVEPVPNLFIAAM